MKVLVTGGSGQLGQCIQELVGTGLKNGFEFIFKTSSDLDISDSEAVRRDFKKNQYKYCINCAAYTQVDKAEKESDGAVKVNVVGAKNLATNCKEFGVALIHVSTDFVFDGNGNKPYTENDICKPLGVYGKTKLDSEREIQARLEEHFIIRTSWLYSRFGNNFMKTMLRLGNEREELSVVDDQHGSPTFAKDLAVFILEIVLSANTSYGVYHYCNQGTTTWYGFAKAIFEFSKTEISLKPISTEAYPTPARRPKYSVLDTSKTKETFGVGTRHWKERLIEALHSYQSQVH